MTDSPIKRTCKNCCCNLANDAEFLNCQLQKRRYRNKSTSSASEENSHLSDPEMLFDIANSENIWLNSKQAAEYLKISQKSLRNKTSNGEIPYYKLGRLNRYSKRELDQLLFSQKRGPEYGN